MNGPKLTKTDAGVDVHDVGVLPTPPPPPPLQAAAASKTPSAADRNNCGLIEEFTLLPAIHGPQRQLLFATL